MIYQITYKRKVDCNNYFSQSEYTKYFEKTLPKAYPVTALLELETTTVYSTVVDKFTSRLKNITAKNVNKSPHTYAHCLAINHFLLFLIYSYANWSSRHLRLN
jgi:hypothetical protein